MHVNSLPSFIDVNRCCNVSFKRHDFAINKDSFERQNCPDDNINIKLGTLDITSSAKIRRKNQADYISKIATKVNHYLVDKGYEPCKNFLISNIAVNNLRNLFGENAGARYLKNFGTIAISPRFIEETNDEGCEMIILHEQGHYLHHSKLKAAGLDFEPKTLLPEEKEIVKNSYIKLFGNQYNETLDKVIDNCYLENTLEFVGWYFTFKNRGCDFGEDVDKIYQKYYGP